MRGRLSLVDVLAALLVVALILLLGGCMHALPWQ